MNVDAAGLAAAAVPHVLAAIGVYGAAVASKAEEASATATVQLGSRLMRRLLRREESAAAIQQAVSEVAEEGADFDRIAVLRAEVRRALQADPQMAADVATLLASAGTTVTAFGAKSVAMRDNTGIVQTGDSSTAWQGRDLP
ncbi:hypothetical protein ACFYL6_16205 [Micromonospora sp. NPDC007208]|uniref:hypothetical protein n=1 Tax=Micromonospora sp. NPDC007208 TaxID=3364236 RepID=UPI00369D728A